MQPHPDSDVRFDSHFLGNPDRLLQLLDFLDHDDDRFAEPPAEHGRADVSAILVAVADDQTLQVLVHGEGGDQFRFRPGLEAKMKLLARVHDLFDDFAQLVDLDRKNAAVVVLVTEFAHRALEGAVDRMDAVTQEILEADDEGKPEPARARFVHDFENVDRAAVFLERANLGVAGGVDGEIASAPALDVIGRDRRLDVPIVFRFFGYGSQRMRIINQRGEHASGSLRKCRGKAGARSGLAGGFAN